MRTSLQQVASLPDPLQTWNWDIHIPNMPGTADSRSFTYKAQTSAIPGFMLESVPVALHGVELRFAGRANNSHSLSVSLIETRDVGTRDMMLRWSRMARDWLTNSGNYKSVYATTLYLTLLDDIPNTVRTIILYGAWPENVGDGSLDGSQSGVVMTEVTFSFDYFDDVVGDVV